MTVDELQIGGRNLVSNSLIKASTNKYGDFFNDVYLEAGKTYTFSIQAKIDNEASAAGRYISCYLYKQDWSVTIRVLQITSTSLETKASTFQAPSTGKFRIECFYGPGIPQPPGSAYIEYYKLEEGNKATPWSPSVEDIKVGGTNLFKNTRMPNLGSAYWAENSNGVDEVTPFDPQTSVISISGNWGRLWPKYSEIPWNYVQNSANNVFTFSAAILRASEFESAETLVNLWQKDVNYTEIRATLDGEKIDSSRIVPKQDTWQRLVITFRKTNNDSSVPRLEPWVADYQNKRPCLFIRNMKLERGYFATDWSPAPEDFAMKSDIPQNALTTDRITVSSTAPTNPQEGDIWFKR